MPGPADRNEAASGAMLGAAAMIAHQVGGKATRDTLFLSSFDVTSLPIMLIGSSIFSIAVVVAMSRAMTRFTPAWVVPRVFALSGVLMLGEWGLSYRYPGLTAVLAYLHMAGLAGVLISGFWSVVNEQYDPRTAKRQVGRIAGGATLGGLVGGLLAERVAAIFSVALMFPILSFLHLLCAWMVYRLQPVKPASRKPGIPNRASAAGTDSTLDILKKAPYLQNLAALVLLATISGVAVDYVFKAQATQMFGRGESLLRFFAFFYTALGVGTFLVQAAFTRLSLEKLGIAKTVGLLPMVLAAGGARDDRFVRRLDDQLAQQEFPRCVHNVQENNQHGDQRQIAALQDHRKTAFFLQRLLRRLCFRPRPRLLAPVHDVADRDARQEHRGAELHQLIRPKPRKQHSRHPSSRPRPERGSDSNDRKQPFALVFGV